MTITTAVDAIRVLVVEDDVVVGRDIELSLESLGYAVCDVAMDGARAVEAALRDPPDLVLMDIRLPGALDGVDAARRIASEIDVPVVFLTAHSDAATLARARDSGSFGYLVKPFDLSGLKAAIEVAVYRHRMESRLRESEERFRVMLRSTREAVVVVDAEGLVAFVNPAAEFLLAQPAGAMLGTPAATTLGLVAEGGVGADELIGMAVDGQRPVYLEGRAHVATSDGRQVPVAGSLSPMGPEPGGVVAVFRNATMERQMEDALRAREARYRRLYEGSLWALFELSLDGMVTAANQAFADLLGYECPEDLVGTSFVSMLAVPVEYEYLRARLASGASVRPHQRRLRCRGEGTAHVVLALDLRPEDDMIIGRVVDLTEERIIDERLERTRRLEAVGKLAAGVAHEFNNLLTVVRGHADLLQETSDDDPSLHAIQEAVGRAGVLVDRLLTVGHGRFSATEPINVADTLRAWMPSLRRAAGPATLEVELGRSDWWVSVDRSQLKEAVEALVENAGYATGDGGAPVTIRLVEPGMNDVDPPPARPLVGIRVDDKGGGMTDEVAERAVDAFYSTWPGRTGLGLSAVHGFAQANGGSLELDNRPGVGVQAVLYLPVAQATDATPGTDGPPGQGEA